MADIKLQSALATVAPDAARKAINFLPDDKQWKFKFEVPGSTGRIYRISFSVSRLCWICSCPGCLGHQMTCKHLRACGLQGPDGPRQVAFAKKHGFIT